MSLESTKVRACVCARVRARDAAEWITKGSAAPRGSLAVTQRTVASAQKPTRAVYKRRARAANGDSSVVLKTCALFTPRSAPQTPTTTRPRNLTHRTHPGVRRLRASMKLARDRIYWRLFLFSSLLLAGTSAQGGQTQFICTSVPKDMDICSATVRNSVPPVAAGDDLKTTVLQLRETVLQQKETIINQKETIRELTSKLSRCESQNGGGAEPGGGGDERGGRRKDPAGGSKNTMGDHVSRGPSDTLAQLAQTLQSLKQRLENLEVQHALTG